MNALHKRAEEFRARMQVRAWEYRQLKGAKGTWYRLRRMLARASEAYEVGDATFAELIEQGAVREPTGDELEPTKNYVFLPRDRVAHLPDARPLRVRLSAELLSAKNVVFVPFAGEGGQQL